jgi:hypothetical protein
MTEPLLKLDFDLVPDDPAQYRSLVEKDWVTIRGKHNRISIGNPTCESERHPSAAGLLSKQDLNDYQPENPDFYLLAFNLTLLPDVECRFKWVDVVLEMHPKQSGSKVPVFVRLAPTEEVTKKALKVKSVESAKLSLKPEPLSVGAEVKGEEGQEAAFERIDVRLASFGAGTQSAGWRFLLTDVRDIPLSSGDLQALVAIPAGGKVGIRFRVAAEIGVGPSVDRLFTRLFVREPRPEASADFEVPPRSWKQVGK